jgi:hypothetical protein
VKNAGSILQDVASFYFLKSDNLYSFCKKVATIANLVPTFAISRQKFWNVEVCNSCADTLLCCLDEVLG